MKRVLEVLPAFSTGGVERYVFDLINRLASNHKNRTFFIASASGSLVDQLLPNVRHFDLPLNKKSKIISNAFSLVKLCKEHKIDRLHVHSRAPAWSCFLASKILKIPYASTYHGAHKAQNKVKRFYNSGMLRGEYVIAISKFIHEHLKFYGNGFEIKDIYEGIDPYQFEPIEVSESILKRQELSIPFYQRVILIPGRFTRIKGQKDFVEALKDYPNLKDIHLLFIGNHTDNKPYTNAIRAICDKLAINYLMLEAEDNLVPYYALADVIVVPTKVPESFGRVIAEALSMNKIVVTFAHGGALELTNDGEFGYLARPNNYKDLVVKLSEALESIPLKGRDFIMESYSLTRMVKEIKGLVYL